MYPQYNGFGYGTPNINGYNNQQLNPYKINHVNGKADVDKFQLPPNGETILVDDSQPIIWIVQANSVGSITATPFSISLYEPEPPVDLNSLVERIKKLEDKLNDESDFELIE